VNKHWREDGSQPVGPSAVYLHSLSFDPVVSETGQQSEGNQDANSNYGKACYNYVRHLLVRFGHTPAHNEDLPNTLPDWLDPEKLADGGFSCCRSIKLLSGMRHIRSAKLEAMAQKERELLGLKEMRMASLTRMGCWRIPQQLPLYFSTQRIPQPVI
jgi:hypothetical protein